MSKPRYDRQTQDIIDEHMAWREARRAEKAARETAIRERNAQWDNLLAVAQNHTGAKSSARRVRVSLARVWSES